MNTLQSTKPDGTKYISKTKPTHEKGSIELDGINWGVVQNDITYTAGVRNVIFRNIFLEKPRIGLSIHFDNDRYSRSYYPNAPIPLQQQLIFDNVRVLHDKPIPFLLIATPVDVVTISNSSIGNNPIKFTSNKAMTDYLKTNLLIYGCSFTHKGPLDLINNGVGGKVIHLKTFGNVALDESFSANIQNNNGQLTVDSDLKGLKK